MTTIDRINTLTLEATQTALDGANLAQKQNAQLVQTWLNAVEANQQTNRELVTRFVQQSQQAQSLWLQLLQDTFRTGFDTVAQASRVQTQSVAETLETATRGANATEKRASAAANNK